MIHAESVKAWEAETEYFRSIIASKEAEIARLRAALEPFGRHADNISLSGALGHITREDLLRAKALTNEQGQMSGLKERVDQFACLELPGQPQMMHMGTSYLVNDLWREIQKLRAQLPSEMQECTILFKECVKGHSRLTATNWVDHGCPHCTIEELRAGLERAYDDAKEGE